MCNVGKLINRYISPRVVHFIKIYYLGGLINRERERTSADENIT